MAGGNLGNTFQMKLRGDVKPFPVAASTHIYRGVSVMIVSGYAVPLADTSGGMYVGEAEEEADNTSGAAGAISVKVRCHGLVVKKKNTTSAATDVGNLMYAHTAHSATVQELVGLTGAVSNHVIVGLCVQRYPDKPAPEPATYTGNWLLIDIDRRI